MGQAHLFLGPLGLLHWTILTAVILLLFGTRPWTR